MSSKNKVTTTGIVLTLLNSKKTNKDKELSTAEKWEQYKRDNPILFNQPEDGDDIRDSYDGDDM